MQAVFLPQMFCGVFMCWHCCSVARGMGHLITKCGSEH